MSEKNVEMKSSNISDNNKKVKILTLPVFGAINLILDMNEYPKLNNHIINFVRGMKTHLSRSEIKDIILEMFGNKSLEEFKTLYEKEYNILTERFGKAIWS